MRRISLDEILDLYVNKKMNSGKIAEKYGCCKATILKRLRAAKITLRPRGVPRLKVSDRELESLYLDKKLSTWKIAELLKCGRSTIHRKLSKLSLARDISASHVRYARAHFAGNDDEKAYVMGFAIGDLRVRKTGRESRTVKIDCGSTKKEQIDLIYSLFSKYGRVWISEPNACGKVQIEAFMDDSFGFLLNCREKIKWAIHGKQFIPFLAGFTDAEGSIFITNGKAAFSLGNYDKELLELIRDGLQKRGIKPVYLYTARKKYPIAGGYRQRQFYCFLKINKMETLLKFFNMLGPYIRHQKRKDDIQKALKHIALKGVKIQ